MGCIMIEFDVQCPDLDEVDTQLEQAELVLGDLLAGRGGFSPPQGMAERNTGVIFDVNGNRIGSWSWA